MLEPTNMLKRLCSGVLFISFSRRERILAAMAPRTPPPSMESMMKGENACCIIVEVNILLLGKVV